MWQTTAQGKNRSLERQSANRQFSGNRVKADTQQPVNGNEVAVAKFDRDD